MDEGEAAVEVVLRLADACDKTGRPGDARTALERALTLAPGDRALRELTERAYGQSGAWHELATLALEDANSSADVKLRFTLLMRAGAVLLEQAGDPEAAIGVLEQARERFVRWTWIAWACCRMHARSWGRAQDALTMIDEVLAPHKGRRSRELAPIYWRLSRVFQNTSDLARPSCGRSPRPSNATLRTARSAPRWRCVRSRWRSTTSPPAPCVR